jgi:hypothetical protein
MAPVDGGLDWDALRPARNPIKEHSARAIRVGRILGISGSAEEAVHEVIPILAVEGASYLRVAKAAIHIEQPGRGLCKQCPSVAERPCSSLNGPPLFLGPL